MNLGWKLHVRNGYANKLLLSTFSSLPKLKVIGTERILLQGPQNINFMHSPLHRRGGYHIQQESFLASQKRNGFVINSSLVFIAGKAWEGLGNIICLQDCRSFHDLRPTNQRRLKVKPAELMSGFSERFSSLGPNICEGLIRLSCRKKGDPLTVCKGGNIESTRIFFLS